MQVIAAFDRYRAFTGSGRIAIDDGDRRLDHAALVARVDGLAGRLGAGDAPIALIAAKSIDGVVGALAIVGAGRPYVAIDPSWPAARVRSVLDQARPSALVVEPGAQALAAAVADGRPVIATDEAGPAVHVAARPDALAYVLFTSGSTGTPKGVMLEHRQVDAFAAWMIARSGLGPGDVVVNPAPLTFDFSVLDLVVTLGSGATLQLIPARLKAPGDVLGFLAERSVTAITAVPSFYGYLSRFKAPLGERLGPSLRLALFGGEAFAPAELATWVGALPGVRFLNAYGPTEAAVFVSACDVDPTAVDALSLGEAAPGCALAVVDDEIWISGPQLARGYLGRPELTADRFVAGPDGGRAYRTGDRGRVREDGAIVFLGRADRQVKLAGHRVELGDVEAALESLPGVRGAAVAFVSRGGLDWLKAFVEGDVEIRDLRNGLTSVLPTYMHPREIVEVSALPRNPAGKIDRSRLPV